MLCLSNLSPYFVKSSFWVKRAESVINHSHAIVIKLFCLAVFPINLEISVQTQFCTQPRPMVTSLHTRMTLQEYVTRQSIIIAMGCISRLLQMIGLGYAYLFQRDKISEYTHNQKQDRLFRLPFVLPTAQTNLIKGGCYA